jgi:hypothetical protein
MILAEMTAGDLAAVIVAITSVVAVVLLIVALVAVSRTLTALRLTIEQMRRETVPVLSELQRTVTAANVELEKIDGLLDSAAGVTATVDSASHLAYLAFSNPLIKGLALATGAARAAKALRRVE